MISVAYLEGVKQAMEAWRTANELAADAMARAQCEIQLAFRHGVTLAQLSEATGFAQKSIALIVVQ